MAERIPMPQVAREALLAWYPSSLLNGAVVQRGSVMSWLFGKFGQAAVTLDQTIHLTPLASQLATREGIALLSHELFHVEQQQEMGWWKFLLNYVVHWRPEHTKNGRQHPMEFPAYARQEEIYRSLPPAV